MHNKDASLSPSLSGGIGNKTTTGSQMQSNDAVFASFYSPLFYDKPSLQATKGSSLYQYKGNSELKYSDSSIQSHNYDSCAIQKHQDMVNLHNMCLTRLLECSKEVEALRQENNHLRAVNIELNKHLSLLIRASIQNQFDGSSCHTTAFDIANGFRGLHIADNNFRDGRENCSDWKDQEVSDESPTSVIENPVEVERFSLPKSISVRSNGYLKMAQTGGAASNASGNTKGATPTSPNRPRTSSQQLDVVVRTHQTCFYFFFLDYFIFPVIDYCLIVIYRTELLAW